jgi:hypothetical protein
MIEWVILIIKIIIAHVHRTSNLDGGGFVMEKNTTEETLYLVDSEPRPVRYTNLALANLVQIWTFIRPARWDSCHIWKVYLVRIGSSVIPMSATDSGYLWRKIVGLWEFRNRLRTYSTMEITVEAWSTEGKRLLGEDLVITGSKVVFKKETEPADHEVMARKTHQELLRENHTPPQIYREDHSLGDPGVLLKEDHVPSQVPQKKQFLVRPDDEFFDPWDSREEANVL